MSAPLMLDPGQLRNLATALEALSSIERETGVDFSSAGLLSATIGDSSLSIGHNGETYIVKDRNGD